MSPSSRRNVIVNSTTVFDLILYCAIPIRQHTVFDVIFHLDTLFQICCVFAILFHSEESFDSCCTLQEEMELFEQLLPHFRRHWFKMFIDSCSVIQQSGFKEIGEKVLLSE
jgi:hypothetical protein